MKQNSKTKEKRIRKQAKNKLNDTKQKNDLKH